MSTTHNHQTAEDRVEDTATGFPAAFSETIAVQATVLDHLDDITVGRLHAEFRCNSRKFQIVDTNGLNGTYLNCQPVDSAILTNDDEIQIGNFRLLYFTSSAAS